jgi:hypothetical protein
VHRQAGGRAFATLDPHNELVVFAGPEPPLPTPVPDFDCFSLQLEEVRIRPVM